MATGLPEGAELQILEALRDKVPAELFTTPYKNPVGGNEEAARAATFAKPRACSRKQGSRIATASWSIPRASRSVSNFCPVTPATSAACCSTSPTLSASA